MGCRPSTPEIVPSPPVPSEVPNDPKNKNYRPSISSLQIPKGDYNLDALTESDAASERSAGENENEEEKPECLYGTDITLEWLLQRIGDKFGKKITTEPQWITERLNRPSWDVEYATSLVVRVTFGWDEDELPKSVVLKTPVSKDLREDDEGKYHFIMFKRECNVYEWTQRYPKLCAPRIYHIKKHSKEGSGVVVMQDTGNRGKQCNADKGLSVDLMRDLLKNLAYLHATSMKHTAWSTLIADLPPSYYAYVLGNFEEIKNFFERKEVDHSRFVHTEKYFNTDYLHTTATESTDLLEVPKVLVHGEPYANNIFGHRDGKHIYSIIDWTECHAGCFAEDLCKAICWNMAPKERTDNTASLLEGYHYHLVRYCNGDCPVTVDAIRKAYDKFLPFAMVTFIGKVMQIKNKPDIEPLIERAKALIQQVYTAARLANSES